MKDRIPDLQLIPDIVCGKTSTSGIVLHFVPLLKSQVCEDIWREKISRNMTLLVLTIYPRRLRRSNSSLAKSCNTFSSPLFHHYFGHSRSQSVESVEDSVSGNDPQNPILLTLNMQGKKFLLSHCLQPHIDNADGTSLAELLMLNVPDSSFRSLLSSSSPCSSLNCRYILIYPPGSVHAYFIPCLQINQEPRAPRCEENFVFDWLREELFHKSVLVESSLRVPNESQSDFSISSINYKKRCDWRSCLAVVEEDSERHLCRFHQIVKNFVDNSMIQRGSTRNSTKFLPKNVSKDSLISKSASRSQMKLDLKLLRSSSTLLHEIWDGRLKNTIASFIRKAENELSIKSFLQSVLYENSPFVKSLFPYYHYSVPFEDHLVSASSSYFLSPPWILWKDRSKLEKMLTSLQDNVEALNAILSSERFVSRELHSLFELAAFPQSELAIVRKEMKLFKEFQQKLIEENENKSNGDVISAAEGAVNLGSSLTASHDVLYRILSEENKVVQHKLSILSEKRQIEQEARNAYIRKMMKLKALEEAEKSDPRSFKNQYNR
jgi:hypothetical protein